MTALRRYDEEIADVYAKLTELESRVDRLRSELGSRCDRIEVRLTTGLAELTDPEDDLGTALSGLHVHLSRLDQDLAGLDPHLEQVDQYLTQLDTGFSRALRGPTVPS